MNISNTLSVVVSSFLFLAYLLVMWQIIGDLFRDRDLGGGKKAVWIIALVLFPFVTALVYVVIRGRGMAERYREASIRARTDAAAHLTETAGEAPIAQIARAKSLLDEGAINADEFAAIKRGALAHVH